MAMAASVTPINLQFNNPLDAKAFQPAQVKVTPIIEGMKVAVYYNGITITGATKGRTTYTVTVDGSLRDMFGQTLGRSEQRTFNVGSALPFLSANGNGFVMLTQMGRRVLRSSASINRASRFGFMLSGRKIGPVIFVTSTTETPDNRARRRDAWSKRIRSTSTANRMKSPKRQLMSARR